MLIVVCKDCLCKPACERERGRDEEREQKERENRREKGEKDRQGEREGGREKRGREEKEKRETEDRIEESFCSNSKVREKIVNKEMTVGMLFYMCVCVR